MNIQVSVPQDPASCDPEPLSQNEKDLLAFRRYKLQLRAQSLKAAGYNLKRLGICCDCGDGLQHQRDPRCADCVELLAKKQVAARLKAEAAVFATKKAA